MKCIFIYNPISGRQRNPKIKQYVLDRLKQKFDRVDCMPTKKAGDAGLFAYEACGKYDVLVVSGGDGTMNEVINAIANVENRPKIGYIPTGTTNDLAHSLGIPTKINKALDIIIKGQFISHDIFKVNDKYGIYVCAFGLFTGSSYLTSQTEKKKLGRFAYFKYGIKELLNAEVFPLKLDSEELSLSGTYVLGIIANSKYVAGYRINKRASYNDGYVNLILVNDRDKKGVSFWSLLKVAKLFLFGIGSLKRDKKCIILKLDKFKIELPKNTDINLDGEKGCKGSFSFETLKQHVDIFVK